MWSKWRAVSQRHSLALGYLIALSSVLLFLMVREVLQPYLGTDAPLLVFILAIIISSWVGGIGPGLLSTFLSGLVGDYFFIAPINSLGIQSSEDRVRLALFLLEGIVLSILSGQLRNSRAKLEVSLAQQTAAKIQAQEANKAKGNFLATMSHEIRTPMTAILGFINLLENPELQLQTRLEYLEIVKRNGKLLLSLIDDVLDLSRIENGKITIEKKIASLSEIITDVENLFEQAKKGHAIELKISVDPMLPTEIWTDEMRLRQILYNLIGNAVKFTQKGFVSLAVKYEAKSSEDSEDLIIFEIRDSGIGITSQQADQLFKPFSQADATITRRFGGTGIGLALSRNIAKSLKGSLILKESAWGEGSLFVLSLPLESVQTIKNKKMLSISSDIGKLSSLKVLLVDDSPDIRLYLQALLKHTVAEIETAEDGIEALRRYSTKSWDLVLMDIEMPKMDGYAVTREFRARGFAKPIIALTAHALPEVHFRCLEAGCTDKITKPIDKAQLINKIAQHCVAFPREPFRDLDESHL